MGCLGNEGSRVGSHGVPSPTYVSKSQHGGKVPTFEFQETIKIWFIFIEVSLLSILCKYIRTYIASWGLAFA